MKANLIKAAWVLGGVLLGVLAKGYVVGTKAKAAATAGATTNQ